MYVSWSIHPSAGWHLCAIDTKNRKKLGLIFVVGRRLLSIANPAGSSVAVKCVVAIVTLSDLLFLIWYPPFSPSLSLTVCSLGSPRTIHIVAFIILLRCFVDCGSHHPFIHLRHLPMKQISHASLLFTSLFFVWLYCNCTVWNCFTCQRFGSRSFFFLFFLISWLCFLGEGDPVSISYFQFFFSYFQMI